MSNPVPGRLLPARPTPAAAPQRDAWLDVARGVTILLVVLMHADSMLHEVGQRSMPVHLGALALYPLRMPLFFLVSGILGASMLARQPGRILTDRVAHFMWVWVVWTIIGHGLIAGLLFPVLGIQATYGFMESKLDLPGRLVSSVSWAWFLYALAMFFTTGLLLRRLPPALHMIIAIALAVPGLLELGEAMGIGVIDRFYYYPYFAAGVLGSAALRRATPRFGRWPVVLPLLGLWVIATLVAHKLDWLGGIPGRFVLSFLAVPAALATAALLGDQPWLRPLRIAGTNTLVIYLLHPYLLRLIVELDRPELIPRWAWAALVVVVATVISIVLQPLLARVPGLLALPWRRPPAPPAMQGWRRREHVTS